MLPKKGSKAWDDEVKFYQSSTRDQRDKRAVELGYSDRAGYQTVMARRGVHLVGEAPKLETTIINLPEIKLKKYEPVKVGKGNPETQILHLTDHHFGQITKSFNEKVYDSRLEHLYKSTVHIANLHRNMYPINDLVIFMTGDMVHGENAHQGAKVGGIDRGARDQVIGLLPKLAGFILSLKEQFKTISIYCVRGNHGRYDRVAPATSNWDMMLYDLLTTKLDHYGIKVDVSDEFYKLVDIQGKRFFLAHFDQFRGSQGVPWFAMTKGIQSWYVTYGGFDYIVGGHFHKDDFLRLSAKTKLIMSGSMVTDDTFTQEVCKTSSIPCQWTFGVNKHKGVTWSYSLIVDEKYF